MPSLVRSPRLLVAATGVAVVGCLAVAAPYLGGAVSAAEHATAPRPGVAVTTAAAADARAAVRPKGDRAPLYPLPAQPVQPEPCPPPPLKGGGHYVPPPPPKPKVPTSKVPVAAAPAPRHVSVDAVTGKGIWLTTWADTHVDVPTVVRRAVTGGLRQLWVRTGGTWQGYYGDRLLRTLLPAAHRAGIAVIAWDFPTLSDPRADAQRARAALGLTVDGQRLDGFSPDIETKDEGTFDSPRRVRYYLSLVRRYAGDRPVVATVMRPTDAELAGYPYAAEAPYVDAFAPMDYWACNEPGALTTASVTALRRFGRPVTVVGQSYDMGPEGGPPGLPSGPEIWRFLDAAKRAGAVGASLWTYEQTGRQQWQALGRYPW